MAGDPTKSDKFAVERRIQKMRGWARRKQQKMAHGERLHGGETKKNNQGKGWERKYSAIENLFFRRNSSRKQERMFTERPYYTHHLRGIIRKKA